MAKTILGCEMSITTAETLKAFDKTCEAEADVIVTSVILGFSATRILAGQPFSFDIEMHPPDVTRQWQHLDSLSGRAEVATIEQLLGQNRWNKQDGAYDSLPNELVPRKKELEGLTKSYLSYQEHLQETQTFVDVVEGLASVLDVSGLKGGLILDAQSPQWFKGARITGRAGGAQAPHQAPPQKKPSDTYRLPREKEPTDRAGLERGNLERDNPGGYYGRGAYTGMIDDPVNHHTFLKTTQRIVVGGQERWKREDNLRHGLISPPKAPDINLSSDLSQGMGPLGKLSKKKLNQGGVIGYVHGMSWAMQECIRYGPWCTPYEMAVGTQTTKMASCFACTTYMYAAGFPPSSIHLGRGESWHPLPENQDEMHNVIASAINSRWHSDIFHYLRYGASLLRAVKDRLPEAHQRSLTRLSQDSRLREVMANLRKGGNLFLDGLTVHKSDWQRAQDTLQQKRSALEIWNLAKKNGSS